MSIYSPHQSCVIEQTQDLLSNTRLAAFPMIFRLSLLHDCIVSVHYDTSSDVLCSGRWYRVSASLLDPQYYHIPDSGAATQSITLSWRYIMRYVWRYVCMALQATFRLDVECLRCAAMVILGLDRKAIENVYMNSCILIR